MLANNNNSNNNNAGKRRVFPEKGLEILLIISKFVEGSLVGWTSCWKRQKKYKDDGGVSDCTKRLVFRWSRKLIVSGEIKEREEIGG